MLTPSTFAGKFTAYTFLPPGRAGHGRSFGEIMMVVSQLQEPIDVRPGDRGRHRVRWTVLALSCLAVAAFFSGQYAQGNLDTLARSHVGLAGTYAHRPVAVQVAFYLHITFAGLALALGPLQFAGSIRRRWPAVHRWTGRGYLAAVAVGSAAGLVMSCFSSVAIAGFLGFGALAVLWAWTGWRGLRAIRGGDVSSHQAWMTRNFALTYAAVTLRLELALLMAVQLLATGGGMKVEQAYHDAYAAMPFVCWIPNLVIAELILRRRGLPSLRLAPAEPAGQASTVSSATERSRPGGTNR